MTDGNAAERLARLEECIAGLRQDVAELRTEVSTIRDALTRARGAAWMLAALGGLAAWMGWPTIRDLIRHITHGG